MMLKKHFMNPIFRFWKEMVVDPSGNTYYYWSAIVMFCVLYNLTILIVRAVFTQPNEGWIHTMWLPLDYTSDFIYLLDMFAKSRIGIHQYYYVYHLIKSVELGHATFQYCRLYIVTSLLRNQIVTFASISFIPFT